MDEATSNSLQSDERTASGGRIMEKLLLELDERKSEEATAAEEDDDGKRRAVNAEGIAGVGGPKTREDSRQLLENIFLKADVSGDRFLDIRELAKWIHAKIIDHIDRAMRDNIGLFTVIDDNPRNGKNFSSRWSVLLRS